MSDKKEIIVFAEDDPSTTKVLRYLLTRDGYQVYNYSSGVGVLEGVKEHRPALILLDIMMPEKDGLTVLKEIREVPEIADTPVILLTALNDESSVSKALEYGVVDFLNKPFKLNDLALRVKKIISVSQNKTNPPPIKQSILEHFKSIVDTIPVLIWESGIDRQCVYLNKSWLDYTGKSFEQGLVNGWIESIHSDDIAKVVESRNSAFDSQKEFKINYRLLHYSGEYRWISENGNPRFTSDHVFLGFIGSCLDITGQQKMESELKVLYQAVLNVPISVIITDNNGVIEYVNTTTSELSGFSYEESVGKVVEIFKRGEISEDDNKQFRKTMLAGKQWKGEVYSKTKNGTKLLEQISISPIKNNDGKITNFVIYKEAQNKK